VRISWQDNYLRDLGNPTAELCLVKAGIFAESLCRGGRRRSGSCRCQGKKEPKILSSGLNVSSGTDIVIRKSGIRGLQDKT